MKKYLTIKMLGWVLTVFVSIFMVISGAHKIIGTKEMVDNFSAMNLTPYMRLVGIMEILGVALLIYGKTSKYGAILLSMIMSGAIAIHLSLMGGIGVLIPVIVGIIGWTSHCMRNEELI